MDHPAVRIWERVKTVAKDWAASSRATPSEQECQSEVRRILSEEFPFGRQPEERLIAFYTRELREMTVGYRKEAQARSIS